MQDRRAIKVGPHEDLPTQGAKARKTTMKEVRCAGLRWPNQVDDVGSYNGQLQKEQPRFLLRKNTYSAIACARVKDATNLHLWLKVINKPCHAHRA
jgi:hypothetical protein